LSTLPRLSSLRRNAPARDTKEKGTTS
jgi:hypothetical protein